MNEPSLKSHTPLLAVLALIIAASTLAAPKAEAQTYTVTILDYLGRKWCKCAGKPLYIVKVHGGKSIFQVELLDPMPCLADHQYERARVTLSQSNSKWTDVTFDGHYARIHEVKKLNEDPSQYQISHTSGHVDHDHNHSQDSKKKKRSIFYWW